MKTTKTALNSSIVKKHKNGVLSDIAPHAGLRLVAYKNGTKSWLYRYRTPLPVKQIAKANNSHDRYLSDDELKKLFDWLPLSGLPLTAKHVDFAINWMSQW